MRESAPALASQAPARDPWERAALLEGVGRELDDASPWGESHRWV